MIQYIVILFLPESIAFCEARWSSNSTAYYSNNTINVSEFGNAISSLTYTLFGVIGMTLRYNTTMYYLLMNLFIITGISSFLHHYHYSNADWAYSADIIATELLTAFSLFYMICDIEYSKSKIINKLCGLIILTICLSMIIFNTTNIGSRTMLLKILMGAIILSQVKICIHLFIINSMIKYKVLFALLWSGILFSTGVILWEIDRNCPTWMIRKFNGHLIWHITVAWSLFNIINIMTVYRSIINQTRFDWKPLISKISWFAYIIIVSNEKTNMINNGTYIEIEDLEEIKLLNYKGYKNHRRSRTIG